MKRIWNEYKKFCEPMGDFIFESPLTFSTLITVSIYISYAYFAT